MSVDDAADHIFGFVIMNDWSGKLISSFRAIIELLWSLCKSFNKQTLCIYEAHS